MKDTVTKCTCDYCNTEMTEDEYDGATRISIRIDVPCQKGGAGECNGLSMSICNECSLKIGIVNEEIHNGQMYTRGRIMNVLKKYKIKILDMVVLNK